MGAWLFRVEKQPGPALKSGLNQHDTMKLYSYFFTFSTDLQLSALLARLTQRGEQKGTPNAQGITSYRPIASDFVVYLVFSSFFNV